MKHSLSFEQWMEQLEALVGGAPDWGGLGALGPDAWNAHGVGMVPAEFIRAYSEGMSPAEYVGTVRGEVKRTTRENRPVT